MISRSILLLAALALISCTGLPKPKFTWLPEDNPEAGDSIWFFNESRRSDAFDWEFGDGGISNSTNPIYIYRQAGIFDVTLKAVNDEGENLAVEPITISEPTILGFTVYDSLKTITLSEAVVWVYDNERDRDSLFTPLYTGITDSVGVVAFQNLESVVYHVWVSKEEPAGSWVFKGYTNQLKINKVNFYNVPCTWRTTSMTVPSTHLMAATARSPY
jgi:PKD repeat protein